VAFDPPSLIELEFRDGKRQVPEYVAAIMAGLETYRMTFEQAMVVANGRMGAHVLNAKRDEMIAAHFKERR
jgi:hypothetical protein